MASADRDPALAFDRNGVAYLAYLADDTVNGAVNHIILSKSVDGGATWVSSDLASGVVYHPFLLVGDSPTVPANDNLYVAYRQDVTEGAAVDSQIHVRASTDGGQTFPINTIINDNSIAGIGNSSYCTLGAGGRLYAAWEDSTNAPTYSNIRVDTSADGGATWGTDDTIIISGAAGTTGVTYGVGASGHYTIPAAPDQGILATPSLAVARTGPNAGRVFVCYTFIAPGSGSLSTSAQTDVRMVYADNLLSGSPTWTAKKVNDDTNAAKSQFHPWMSLDPTSNILYFTWSDCRNSSSNNTAQRYATFSTDGGATIKANVKISDGTSNESGTNANRDRSNYGDYNAGTSFGGVIDAAWTDNANQTSNDVYFDRVALNNQAVTATGTAADDSYYLRLDPSGLYVRAWENRPEHTGTPDFTLLRTAMSGLTLNPGAGKNAITVDYTNGNPLPAAGVTINAGADDTLSVVGTAAAGTYAVNAGTLTLSAAGAASTTGNLSMSVAAGATLKFGTSVNLTALTVAGGATAGVAASPTPGTRAVVTRALTLTGTAKFDVGNGGLVVDYTGTTSPLATVKAAVKSGYNPPGGAWTGTGVTSLTAAGNAGAAGVGYAEASEVLQLTGAATGTFMGQAVDATALLVRFTLLGDATLDGTVDFNDLVRVAQNYNTADGTGNWSDGDFTYDGNVDFNDLVKLAQSYNVALAADGGVGAAPFSSGESLASAFVAARASVTDVATDRAVPANIPSDASVDSGDVVRRNRALFSVTPVVRGPTRPPSRRGRR